MPESISDLDEVRRIVLSGLAGYRARVLLFGSWANGKGRRTSDIDVAVLPVDPLPIGLLSDIREDLEDSHVLYPVDLIDLSESGQHFRQIVEAEGVVWRD